MQNTAMDGNQSKTEEEMPYRASRLAERRCVHYMSLRIETRVRSRISQSFFKNDLLERLPNLNLVSCPFDLRKLQKFC
jgi:hypothetical protein